MLQTWPLGALLSTSPKGAKFISKRGLIRCFVQETEWKYQDAKPSLPLTEGTLEMPVVLCPLLRHSLMELTPVKCPMLFDPVNFFQHVENSSWTLRPWICLTCRFRGWHSQGWRSNCQWHFSHDSMKIEALFTYCRRLDVVKHGLSQRACWPACTLIIKHRFMKTLLSLENANFNLCFTDSPTLRKNQQAL